MFRNLCSIFVQNKNSLMLVTTGIYILALFSVLSKSLLPITTLLMLVFFVCLWKDFFKPKYVFIWVMIFCLGVINISLRLRDVDELLSLSPINSKIVGTIVSIPQGRPEGSAKFYFDVDRISFQGVNKDFTNEKVLVSYDFSPEDSLNIYDYCEFEGRLSVPFKAGNPSQFDYGNYLQNHNAHAVFYAKKYSILSKKLSIKQKVLRKINDYRDDILSVHSEYLKSPNLEILGGIVFGDDAVSPPKEIKKSFVNSGLLHILAASGMNVAFIFTFFYCLLSIFRINYKLKVGLGIVTVLLYCLMTGLGASVIRATAMLVFVLIGKLLDRDAHSISLLSFVALLMLIYNPLFINDIGFQLSFIVTFGILVMSPLFAKVKNRFLNSILSTIFIPIIAQLWVMPVQIFYFNNISLYSVFANIMSVPILMILSFGGFISSLISVITPVAHFVCKLFDLFMSPLLDWLINISDFWGQLPYSAIQTSHPSVFQIIIYYMILLMIVAYYTQELREKYSKYIKAGLLCLFITILLTFIPIKNSNLEIIVFDVGNADCILIKTPDNHYSMIDTGKSGYKGGKSQAEFVIMKYLKDKGIKALENLIITHFDNDHCGGAVDLMMNLNIKNIYVNDINHSSFAAKNILQVAKDNSIKIIQAKSGQVFYDNKGVIMKNYVPKIKVINDNDNSIITSLTYGSFSILFTGDAGWESLRTIINDIKGDVDVLKVPHHGANGCLDYDTVAYLNPKVSIISVGENKFGHPARQILDLLKNSTVLRTDRDNSIRIKVGKKEFQVYSYNINAKKYEKVKL